MFRNKIKNITTSLCFVFASYVLINAISEQHIPVMLFEDEIPPDESQKFINDNIDPRYKASWYKNEEDPKYISELKRLYVCLEDLKSKQKNIQNIINYHEKETKQSEITEDLQNYLQKTPYHQHYVILNMDLYLEKERNGKKY